MDLSRTWRVELRNNKNERLLQYVEAISCSEAEKIAKNSFNAKLSGLNESYIWMTSQKASSWTKLKDGKLQFHFDTGWYSFNVNGLTFYESTLQTFLQMF